MSGPFLSTVRRPRRRARRALVVLALVAGLVAVLAVAFGAIALLERDTLPRGTTIAGVDVGGSTESEARVAVARAAAARLDLPDPPRRAGRRSRRDERPRASRNDRSSRDAVAEADHGGSLARVLARVGLRHGRQVELAYRLGPVAAAKLADRLDDRFGDPWRDARVDVAEESIRVVEARPGTGVDRKALRRSLRTLPTRVQLRIVTVRPVVSSAEATAAASRVEGLLDGPRRVRFRDADATLTRQRLRLLVRTEPEDGGLAVSLEPKGLGASLRVKLGRFEVAPRNATFAVGAAGVRVVPSRPGRTLDVDADRALARVGPGVHDPSRAVRIHVARTDDRGRREAGHPRARLGVHDLLLVLPAARHEHPARGADARRDDRGTGRVLLAQRRARQADGRARVRLRAADLRRAARGRGRRRHQPGRHDALQRRVLRRREARRPPGAPVLHLALPDGARGDRLVGRPGARLPQRLAGGDPHEGRRDRLVDQRPLLLPQARTARGDDDGGAVRVHAARDDPDAELGASPGNDQHRPVGRRVRVHGAVHAEGVPGVEAPAQRALHRSL